METKINWTEEMLVADAKRHQRRSEWQKKSGAAYIAAYRKGKAFFEKCCQHMIGKAKVWTDKELIDDAKKYNRRSDWHSQSKIAYKTAFEKGIVFFEKCCKHMRGYKQMWTDDELLIDAKKYRTRTEWKKESQRMHAAALRKSAVFYKKCCNHMRSYESWMSAEKIKADAKKYKSPNGWRIKSAGAYLASLRIGMTFHEECCAHMR